MTEWHVREGRAGDGAAVGAVQTRSWRAAYAGLMPPAAYEAMAPELAERSFEGAVAEGAGGLWVAVREDEVAGFVRSGPTRAEGAAADVGEVLALYLDPLYQRKGLGRRLLRRAFDDLAAGGFRVATCFVLEGNEPAARFYSRAGMSTDGRTHPLSFAGLELPHLRFEAVLSELRVPGGPARG